MTKIEKALAELDALMEEVNMLRKEEEEENMDMEDEKMMSEKLMEDENMMSEKDKMMSEKDKMMNEKGEFMDDEAKAYVSTLDGAGVEIGEPADRIVIEGGRPKASDLPVVKAFNNEELETLDLSVGNIEKAYEAFRQEQLEKLAYDNLQKQFEARFKAETSSKENFFAKA